MAIPNSIFTLENNTYFIKNNSLKTPIPTNYFRIFYDTILAQLAGSNCLTEIKCEVKEVCKAKVDGNFSALSETIDLLFYLTLELRRTLSDQLYSESTDGFIHLDKFNGIYTISLLKHKLPFPEHPIFDSRKVLSSLDNTNRLVENSIEAWKLIHPEIAQIEIIYQKHKDTPQHLIIQQIIQHCMNIEFTKSKKIDNLFVSIKVQNHIVKSDFLKNLFEQNQYHRIIQDRIIETKKILLASHVEQNNITGKKRKSIENEGTVPNTNSNNNIPEKMAFHHPNEDLFLMSYFDTYIGTINNHISQCRTNAFHKFQNEYGTISEERFSRHFKNWLSKVIQNEIINYFSYLIPIAPLVQHKPYEEINNFVQKLIQWEISRQPNSNTTQIVNQIIQKLNTSSLPFLKLHFSHRAIADRVKKTKELMSDQGRVPI